MADKGIILSEYQKKLKTMKKKFFVLYKDTNLADARLEYYDTEKKFIQKADPKRVIFLKTCFNINRRLDTKHKFVLTLSSREGGFGIVFNTEDDLQKWLSNLLSIQRENIKVTDQACTSYEYVWQVIVQKKGMSVSVGIIGNYHCCLTSKSITFICIGPEKMPSGDDRILKVEILLTTIRRCGHASPQNIFYMELGRQSVLGSGELWMETEDASIAKHMHDMILSAMSAKSESNMNILNIQKGSSDLKNEPMRKRSSSANEASKPINVLQKRHNAIEVKNSFSPQYNSYGRERCDSLPSRNRTISECSNQTYIALKQANRCISGSRSYLVQRHSDSPPTYSMKCPESEESSISVDESYEKSILDAYRINSITMKAMIPEENIDDDALDSNKASQINVSGVAPDLNTLINATDETMKIYFPEHTSEKIGQNTDVDNQCVRPSRAYSIGSKIEHIKRNKLLGNIAELDNSSPRVRAYSVGSNSNVPRCDIQRGFISTLKKEANRIGSICDEDSHTCNEGRGLNTHKEMKSTSAPLLNLKSYISPVRMSDLMEIDFSNGTTDHRKLTYSCQIPKTGQTELSFHKSNTFNLNGSIKHEMLKKDDLIKKSNLSRTTEISDTGYLEMKPVKKVLFNGNQKTVEEDMEQLKLRNEPGLQLLGAFDENRDIISSEEVIKDVLGSLHENNLHKVMDDNIHKSCFKSDLPTNTVKKKIENTKLHFGFGLSNFTTVERKLIHSISDEDYTKHISQSNVSDTKDVGYQILQIKSDSSLISNKQNQRPSYKPKCRQFLVDVNKMDRKKSQFDSPSKCTSNKNASDLLSNDAFSDSSQNRSEQKVSVGLCELYYASLDFPQCSGNVPANCGKKNSCESPPIPPSYENSSSYAKIDFEQSDSSSASSKMCNI